MTEEIFRNRLQTIIDWADFAKNNASEFDSHGVRNLSGPIFDAAREALATLAPAANMGGASFEIVARAYALDKAAASDDAGWTEADVRDAFTAGARFGKLRAANDFLATQRGYQERVSQAHHAIFHDDPTDVSERVARFFEEAAETCQAFGMSHYDADKLLTYTFGRPVGEPEKEIGAAALTLASLCIVAGHDMMACAEADLEKLQRPETIARIRAKRATRHGRGPLPGIDPSASTTTEEQR